MPDIDPTTNQPLKRCKDCGEWKPATYEYFYKAKTTKDKLMGRCKPCHNIRTIAWQKNNPEQVKNIRRKTKQKNKHKHVQSDRERATQWRIDNPERAREAQRRYKTKKRAQIRLEKPPRKVLTPEERRERKRACDKRLRERDIELTRQIDRERYAKDPERKKAAARNRYLEKPDEVKQRAKEWRIANPDRKRVSSQRRLARKRALPDTFTANELNRMIAYWDGRCAYCGNPPGLLADMRFTVDHFIPLESDKCPGTVPLNMLPACTSCNSSKKQIPAEEFVKREFGPRKARQILKRIAEYFEWVKERE